MNRILILLYILIVSLALSSQNNMDIIAQFQGEHHTAKFGMSMASLDFNHDGFIDLVVGSPSYGYVYGSSPSRGKVYIYYGGTTFNSDTPASVTLEGTYNGATGWKILEVYNVGDINGDGFDDLCIRDYAPWSTWEQRLMYFYGGISNLSNPDFVMNISSNTDIGLVNKLGDVNGDGFEDVGLSFSITGQHISFSVLMGGNLIENLVMTYPYYQSVGGGMFTLGGIGDINNDGYADFTIAYTDNDPYTGYHLINIYYGNSTGVFSAPQTLIQTQDPITKVSKALGDINNDGFDDFMGYLSNNGTHVWLGSRNLNVSTPSFNLTPGWTGDETSRTLMHGDFNNDGYEDVVGASYHLREADVYLGRAIPNGTSDLIVHQYLHSNFGFSIATGDFNADGYCDIAIAASHEDTSWPTGTFYGFVFIYGGNALLADTTVENEDEYISTPNISKWDIVLSPNPFTHNATQFNIKFIGSGYKHASNLKADVYDIKGRKVFSKSIPNNKLREENWKIALKDINPGIYILNISDQYNKLNSSKFTIE